MEIVQGTVHVRQVVERINVLDERGKRLQVTASFRVETTRDSDGFIDETRVPEEARAPDGELLAQDGSHTFVGQQSRKRFTRVDF
jgi:hypothetical protein